MVTLVKHDLQFILKQIKIAEAHSAGGDLATLVAEAGNAAGAQGTATGQAHLLPYGLRTVDGTYNNLIEGRETWGAAGDLLNGERGMATWADVRAQALNLLGIELTDADVGSVPMLLVDPYGNFIPDPVTGYAQLVTGLMLTASPW